MRTELQIKIKHHNKISKILNEYGFNILYSGVGEHRFFIYSLNRDIHRPISSAIVGELKDWNSIIKKIKNEDK